MAASPLRVTLTSRTAEAVSTGFVSPVVVGAGPNGRRKRRPFVVPATTTLFAREYASPVGFESPRLTLQSGVSLDVSVCASYTTMRPWPVFCALVGTLTKPATTRAPSGESVTFTAHWFAGAVVVLRARRVSCGLDHTETE